MCQVFQQRILDCLGLVLSLNLRSIAFPTIGCGNLRYPVDKVAKCFRTAVAATNNLKVRQLVINPGVAHALPMSYSDLYLFSYGILHVAKAYCFQIIYKIQRFDILVAAYNLLNVLVQSVPLYTVSDSLSCCTVTRCNSNLIFCVVIGSRCT